MRRAALRPYPAETARPEKLVHVVIALAGSRVLKAVVVAGVGGPRHRTADSRGRRGRHRLRNLPHCRHQGACPRRRTPHIHGVEAARDGTRRLHCLCHPVPRAERRGPRPKPAGLLGRREHRRRRCASLYLARLRPVRRRGSRRVPPLRRRRHVPSHGRGPAHLIGCLTVRGQVDAGKFRRARGRHP